jgi:DNA-binding transcriptional regulator YiaG
VVCCRTRTPIKSNEGTMGEAEGQFLKGERMAAIEKQIDRLRAKLELSQRDFAKILDTTAMSISRWERGENLPDGRALLKMGLLAKQQSMDGWMFWHLAGVTRADALSAVKHA